MAEHPWSDRVREFLARPRFATIATTGEDGAPHQAVIWFRPEPDGTILVNSRAGRTWPADLRRDGRLSLAIMDDEDPLRWVGVVGRVVEVIDDLDQARDDIVELARWYGHGHVQPDTEATFRSQQRVSFRLGVERVQDHLDD